MHTRLRLAAVGIVVSALGCSGGGPPPPPAASVPPAPATPAPTPAPVRRVEVEGWTLEVLGVKTRKEPLFINEPTFSFGPARPSKGPQGHKIGEKGLVWLVSVEALRKGKEPGEGEDSRDLWARDMALLDDQGQRLQAAGGGPEDASLFLKGMGFNKSGRGTLAFEVPPGTKPLKLQVGEEGPTLDVPSPQAEPEPSPAP